MKTIEERAKEYANENFEGNCFSNNWSDLQDGYVKGATDQRAIDYEELIDKACKWLIRTDCDRHHIDGVFLNEFRKAMNDF